MRRSALSDLVFLPGELPALAVPLLPVTEDYVAVLMLSGSPGQIVFEWIALQQLILVPVILGLAMVASTTRQAVAGPLSRAERIVAYALAFVVLAMTAFVCVGSRLGLVLGPTFLLMSIGTIVILAATRGGPVPPHVHAHVALLVAWIVNAGLTAVGLFADPGWAGPGPWVVAVSVVAVSVEAVVRVRRALRSGGVAGAEAGEP